MDKAQYWKNREAGKRGQGPYPNLVVSIDTTPAKSVRGLGLRRKTKNRIFTKPNHGKLFSVNAHIKSEYLRRVAKRMLHET